MMLKNLLLIDWKTCLSMRNAHWLIFFGQFFLWYVDQWKTYKIPLLSFNKTFPNHKMWTDIDLKWKFWHWIGAYECKTIAATIFKMDAPLADEELLSWT